MKAKEAKELAIKNTPKVRVDDVLKEVEKAATSGNSYTYYYKPLTSNDTMSLRALGYRVESVYDRDGYIATITW